MLFRSLKELFKDETHRDRIRSIKRREFTAEDRVKSGNATIKRNLERNKKALLEGKYEDMSKRFRRATILNEVENRC